MLDDVANLEGVAVVRETSTTSRVAAVVQCREGREITLAGIDAHCRTKIAGYKVPRQLTVVDQVVRSPSGKPDYRWAKATAESWRSR